MIQVQSTSENYISWIVGQGDMNYWYHKWLEGTQLVDVIDVPSHLASFIVKQVLRNESNAFNFCEQALPLNLVNKLREWACKLLSDGDRCI